MMDVMRWTAPTVAENLAFDEVLAKSAWSTGRHLLRFWWGGSPAVVMGSNEQAEQVVDGPACARHGVEVLKRCTGGGAVLQTGNVLNYSLIMPAPDHLNLETGFRQGAGVVCAILAAFGIAGAPEGTSDVAVGDRKISGNAQARRWKTLHEHLRSRGYAMPAEGALEEETCTLIYLASALAASSNIHGVKRKCFLSRKSLIVR